MTDWTAREEKDVVRWYLGGMTTPEISAVMDPPRSANSIQCKLMELQVIKTGNHAGNGSLPVDEEEHELARRALHSEIKAAQRERATSPPFKLRPADWKDLLR